MHRFLADFRDLMSWINDMKSVIGADELAKDVNSAEALLGKLQYNFVNVQDAPDYCLQLKY